MKRVLPLLIATLFAAPRIVVANEPELLKAAQSFRADARWKLDLAITADVDCDRKLDHVLLGNTQNEVIVLVFRSGLKKKPDSIAFPTSRVTPETALLETEPLDVTDKDFQEMLGATPEGYRRSKKCKGLVLSDGQKDALHLYWHKSRHEFNAWSL